jgi:protein tyrosine phosphatase
MKWMMLIPTSSKGRDQPIFGTASGKRHREASPICEMDNPVLEVLEGMRVQRMSLVQSLRQFVFVHKGTLKLSPSLSFPILT